MGTNKTRQAVSSSTNKDRLNFTTDLMWEHANDTWDDSLPMTWDDSEGTPHATAGTLKTRQAVPTNSNKTRN